MSRPQHNPLPVKNPVPEIIQEAARMVVAFLFSPYAQFEKPDDVKTADETLSALMWFLEINETDPVCTMEDVWEQVAKAPELHDREIVTVGARTCNLDAAVARQQP